MRIGVAGSMQHTEKMLALCDALESLGHSAFMSKFADHYVGRSDAEIEAIKLDDKFNHDAVREFWSVMQDADALLVANYDKNGVANYVGGNTLMEIGFAHVLNQQIYLLNPVPDIPYYRTEIEAVRPIILSGDLTKIA